jgi:methionyl-tRNA formyltransferase
MNALRVVFMGSAGLSCASLRALLDSHAIQIVGVVTQPDRPKGRHLKPQPSPVKELAAGAGLPVLQPQRAREPGFADALGELRPDLVVVAAFGQILPERVLALPRSGCINVHTSLLPKYRGAAPIQWAILNGEEETGVTIMKMDAGLDTGDILAQATTPIGPEDTSETLHERLARMGAELLLQAIPDYVEGKIAPRPQSAQGVSYAPKIGKQDGAIDWTRPACQLRNRVRALVPWPGAFTYFAHQGQSHLLKIWRAEESGEMGEAGEILSADKEGILVGCGQGSLRITQLQREGGKRLTAQEFIAGHPLSKGQRLG